MYSDLYIYSERKGGCYTFDKMKTKVNDWMIGVVEGVNENKYQKAVLTTATVAGVAVAKTNSVGALDSLVSSLQDLFKSLYENMMKIVTYIYVVVMIFTLISRLVARNPQSIQTSNTIMKNATITFIIIRIFGLLLTAGKDAFKQESIDWK